MWISLQSILLLIATETCLTVGADQEENIGSQYVRHTRNLPTAKGPTNRVLSTVHCVKCHKKYEKTFKDLETYAELNQDSLASLSPSFTICTTTSTPVFELVLPIFTLLDKDKRLFLEARIYPNNDPFSILFYSFAGNNISPNQTIPLMFPHQWVRSCMAVSTESGQVRWVLDGQLVEDRVLDTLNEAADNRPTDIRGKLLLGACGSWPAGWWTPSIKVTDLNIFSSFLSFDRMVSITSGGKEGCGEEGDYLAWRNTQWTLHGEATMEEVGREELCEETPWVNFYSAEFSTIEDCMQHCDKLGGRAPSVTEQTEWIKLKDYMKEKFYGRGHAGYIWLSVTDEEEEGVWKDYYTQEVMKYKGPFTSGGTDGGDKQNCAQQANEADWVDWFCDSKDDTAFCSCLRDPLPYLYLRGLCPTSALDSLFLPMNDRQDITRLHYKGNYDTNIEYCVEEETWKMRVSYTNTTARSQSSLVSYVLGKHNWTIEMDKGCNKGNSYSKELKLTGCKQGEFTCNDGQCIMMEQRCDQVLDCRDESDEVNCEILIIKGSYRKSAPPVTKRHGKRKVTVKVSINLLDITAIKEADNEIYIKFSIELEWLEQRATYLNLKTESSQNTLESNDVSRIWIPKIIYKNNKDNFHTLSAIAESSIFVERKGNFTRSGLDDVEEKEKFKGEENPIKMTQSYTKDFKCQYKLQRFPFDTQVSKNKKVVKH